MGKSLAKVLTVMSAVHGKLADRWMVGQTVEISDARNHVSQKKRRLNERRVGSGRRRR